MGEPLVTWSQGQPVRLTPFADRLLWAEKHARTRLAPHIEALRTELERALAEALDGSQQVLTIFASHDLALAQGRCLVAGFHVPPLRGGSVQFAGTTGSEAAARQFGLDFIPLIAEDCYLVCLKDALDHPAVHKLRQA